MKDRQTIIMDEEGFKEQVQRFTDHDIEVIGSAPEQYPCIAYPEYIADKKVNLGYLYVDDASALLLAKGQQRVAETDGFISMDIGVKHTLTMIKADNGFVINAIREYIEDDKLKTSGSVVVATTEDSFIGYFAGYASSALMKPGYEMALKVFRKKESERKEEDVSR